MTGKHPKPRRSTARKKHRLTQAETTWSAFECAQLRRTTLDRAHRRTTDLIRSEIESKHGRLPNPPR